MWVCRLIFLNLCIFLHCSDDCVVKSTFAKLFLVNGVES